MIKIEKAEDCCGCGACAQKCPKKCIELQQDSEGFFYPRVNLENCINCGLCESVCPFRIETNRGKAEPLECWACHTQNTKIIKNSSSGGIFSLLAENVIAEKGIVYGTAMTEDCLAAKIISVENIPDLKKLQGSKYLQSTTGMVFSEIEYFLKDNRIVLFSGTPCQVSALKLYLGKEYENLFCVDIVCHGTPSPLLWKNYVRDIEKKYHKKIVEVNFRYKEQNWEDFEAKKGLRKTYVYINRRHDTYMQMFLRNYCLRPSCYNCKSKFYNMSDITLGDFWGIERIAPQAFNKLGTSLALIRTEKGRNLFHSISDCTRESVSYLKAVDDNKAEYQSVERPIERASFFVDMNQMSYRDLYMKYLYPLPKHKLKKVLIDMGIWRTLEKILGKKGNNMQYGMLLGMEKKK